LEATLPAGVTRAQVRQMLEKLLADRLQIEMHHEQRAMSVYLLEVAKGGPKLQPPAPTPHSESDAESRADQQKRALEGLQKILAAREANAAGGIRERQPSRGFHLAHASMQLLAQFLSFNLDRPVIDKTGLDGEFSCQLRWDPDRTGATSEPGSGLSIFTAIQEQLGLKLEAAKETADFVVIDKANRTPPEN
jgi:uncharacterized protein (TIGR03435 family)